MKIIRVSSQRARCALACMSRTVGRWIHTFSWYPVSVAVFTAKLRWIRTNARHTQRLRARRNIPQHQSPNVMQSYQRRSINSYGYYYLNTTCYCSFSSSSSSSSFSVCSPPEHVLDASATRVNPYSRSCR